MNSSFFVAVEYANKLGDWLGGAGLRIAAILIGAWLLRKVFVVLVGTLLRRALHLEQAFVTDLDREKRMETFITLINAVLSVLVWVIAGMLILQELGIQTGPLLTGAGVLGVGLAFGAQALMKDFISGLFIVLENQYRVGDEVELDATTGIVEHVGIRTTVLRDEEGNVHFVPNGSIQRTTNKSMGFTTLRLSLTTAAADHSTVKSIVNRLGDKMHNEKIWLPQIADPLHYQEMGDVSDKTIEFIITGRVKNAYRDDIYKEFRKRLLEKLAAKEITAKKLIEKPFNEEEETTPEEKGKKETATKK